MWLIQLVDFIIYIIQYIFKKLHDKSRDNLFKNVFILLSMYNFNIVRNIQGNLNVTECDNDNSFVAPPDISADES